MQTARPVACPTPHDFLPELTWAEKALGWWRRTVIVQSPNPEVTCSTIFSHKEAAGPGIFAALTAASQISGYGGRWARHGFGGCCSKHGARSRYDQSVSLFCLSKSMMGASTFRSSAGVDCGALGHA